MQSVPANAFVTQAAIDAELSEERGGDSNIIPPSNSQRVTGSEDTAVISCGVQWGPEFGKLVALLELRKQEAQQKGIPSAVAVGSYLFSVSSSGFSAGGYVAYKLSANDVRFGISTTQTPTGDTANVYITMGSSVLMYNNGIEPVWWYCKEVIAALGGELTWHKISRIDMCVDLWDVPVADLYEEYRQGHVTRARYKAMYQWGNDISGFVLGKGDITLRAYDKRLETEKNPTKWDIIMRRRCPEDWDGRDCTRVEYQARREFLKSLGVNTIEDWIAFRASVIEYLTKDWCRVCTAFKDRTHTTRYELSPLWEKVREQFVLWMGTGQAAKRTFADIQYNGEGLVRMAIGCLGRVVASRAEGEMYSLDEFLTRCRQVLADSLFSRDIEGIQERCILGYAASNPYIGPPLETTWDFVLDE